MKNTRRSLEKEIYRKLSEQSYFASLLYLPIFLMIVFITPISHEHPVESTVFGVLLGFASAARFILARRYVTLTRHSMQVWKAAFSTTVILMSLLWGAFGFFVISHYGISQTSMVMLFPTAGMISGTVLSLALAPWLLRTHMMCITMPLIIGSLMKWNEGGDIYALLTGLYLVYVNFQARNVCQLALADMKQGILIASQNTELEMAWAKALAAAKVKNDFISMMSQEIRTPLNGILETAQLLGEQDLTAKSREHQETIRDCGSQLLALVDEILDFSKLEAGQSKLELRAFDLRKCLHGSMEPFKNSARRKGLSLNLYLNPTTPNVVVGDAEKLKHILVNLIGNALKFTSEGEISINVNCRQKDIELHELHISVEDTGIGISPESLVDLFRPFTQAEKTNHQSYNGTGLGLAICKRLSEMMGGGIRVYSELDKGSVFSLRVPIQVIEQRGTIEARNFEPAIENLRQPTKLLLVENDSSHLKIISAMIEKAGYEFDVVNSGLECLEILSTKKYALVLMNCHNLKMDGIETARKIRAMTLTKDLPIVAVAASESEENHEKYFESGMTALLATPVKFPVFASTIKNALSVKPAA